MVLKRLTAVLLIVCMMATFMPTAFAATQNYKDFPDGWSKEAMIAAVNNGLLVGVNATEVRPTANLTRAELATIVVRAFGAKTTADISAFTDVPENSWYYDYISKAVKMEALKGDSETTMNPLMPITREEVFTVLSRILVLESDNSSVLSKFKDGGKVSDWAVKGISALVEKGYVNGDNLGNLNPKANITREEFAQFMHNMIKVYITKPGIYTEDLTGITVLRVGGVTIKNMKQVNDLVAGDGVMFDDVKLEDVEISGRLLARGGEFTLKRTTVSENVVVKNVNGVVHFNNYRDEKVFKNINEITKATFLSRSTGNAGGPSVSTTVTIKFMADGKEIDEVELEKGSKFESLPDAPKTGYTFLGWFDGDTKINVGDKVPSSDTTLVAKYKINQYKVTFKFDNGDPDFSKDYDFGTSILDIIAKDLPDFKKQGYVFDGWDPEIDDNTTLNVGGAVYTAQWIPGDATYTVKHFREDLDGNYDETNTELYFEEVVDGITGEKTQATAKKYEGFTVLSFEQKDVASNNSTVVEIYYVRNTYTVTFVKDNGEKDVVYENVKFETPIKPLAPTGFEKEGCVFDKWDPEIDDNTKMLHEEDGCVIYTALWVPEKVTVRFVVGKYGNPSVLDEIELDYGATVSKDEIDSQAVYSTDLYSYKKKSSYAPFYNGETHFTCTDYWYINENNEWEQFDENVVIKKDTDVYAWYNYLRVQLSVPQFTSFAPPLLVTYAPDQTRIMDTAKDMLYVANNVWLKNFINEDKYLELREKAFAKAAKTGVIDEVGQIMVTELPVKITSVIKPEDIHKEVREYIRDIITHEDKLEQIFNMVSPSDLITLIGVEEVLGMLNDQQIADIINGMDTEDIIDLIIEYPDVHDIVVDALKDLITPDGEGNVPDIVLRDKVILQIEHQLATDSAIREHILGDVDLLDWVLTSFEGDIEDFILTDNGTMDDEFIHAILSEDTIRIAIVEKLLANDSFVELLKNNGTLKEHLLKTIRGDISDEIIGMLDPATGNADFRKAILDAVKSDDELLDALNGSMNDSLLDAMGSFGTSADIKAYVLHIANEHYGNSSSYTGDYSAVISKTEIKNIIYDLEDEIRAQYAPYPVSDDDVEAAVLQYINDSWDTIFGDASDSTSVAYKVEEYKNGAIDAFVTNNGDLTGTDYASVQGMIDEAILSLVSDFVSGSSFDSDIEDKIATIMMEFAMQDVDSVSNTEIKSLLTTAQNSFKNKAKELDADTITTEFVSYRDKDSNNANVLRQVIEDYYEDIITHIETHMFDAEGNLDTSGEIYQTVDYLLEQEAENIPVDTFALLLNMLLNKDSEIISEYFGDFVDNPDNRDTVREQVENYINNGNIDATFVSSHRSQIENALTNEGIDLSTYVTVDVVKTYVNNLGDPANPDDNTAKIEFADKVYEALEQIDEYNEFMSSFDNEKDSFKIHKDNTLFVMGIAEAIKSFDYDTIIGMVRDRIPENKFVDKAIDLFGDAFLEEMFTEAQTNYYQGIVDIVNDIEADKAAGVEPSTYDYPTSLTFKANLVEALRRAYDKGVEKAISILDEKGINYTENQYLNYLLTNDYLDEILYYDEGNKFGEYTGYELKSEEEYAEMVVKYAILLDDAVCWYGDNLTEEKIQAITSAVLTKTFNLHDKLNEILTEYRATGNLPEKAESVIEGIEQVNKLFAKFQPKLDKVIDKYLASVLNKEFEADDVLGKDKVQTGLDIMLGTDDPTFTIDFLYELFYRYDDKAQGKLKQLIDSGKLEKAVKKFEETELVKIIGMFTDNSKVTSLAEKADEIKNSGRVKSSFNSIYDLLVLISEHGIEPFRTDEDVITVIDAYEVSIKGITLKIAREFNT